MADVSIRRATPADAGACADIMFAAFESFATRHAFPIEPGTPEFTGIQIESMLATDGIYGVIAERSGEVLGSAFADERGLIVGIGPVSVDPGVKRGGVGRTLMESLLHRSAERDVAGVRLVQTAYNYRSLSLYAKLGFAVREPLSVFQGEINPGGTRSGDTRVATVHDVEKCDDLCQRVHGFDRHGELCSWIAAGTAHVLERGGQITGYATGCGYFSHAVGETDDDVIALLAGAELIAGLGVLVPSRNSRLMAWCLESGLRLVQQSTLMTIGMYNEPRGSWLPSIGY
jgi:predicted N-acetyltransferase YhbS